MKRLLLVILATILLPAAARAAETSPVKIETVWSTGQQVKPGTQTALAVVFDIKEHFHIYPTVLREETNAFPTLTEITVSGLPKGVHAGALQVPPPVRVPVLYTDPPKSIEAYTGRVALFLPIVIDENAPLASTTFKLTVTYGACNERSCLQPVTMDIPVTLDITSTPAASPPADPALFKDFDLTAFARLGQTPVKLVNFDFLGWKISINPSGPVGMSALLALAAIGGLLLNFTPCVLPVIPIKIMGLSHAAGNRARCLLLGTMASLGVVIFWLGLGWIISSTAAALASGASNPEGSHWGLTSSNELFQKPWFTIGVGVAIGVMAIGMSGFFTVRLPQWVYQLNPQQGSIHGSIGFGIMTAVLSTPCTAPFMGGAAAWAVTQENPWSVRTTFAAIGVGMAIPYLILSAFPRLVNKMPRTGPGSELIKQVMGILMLAAAAYFIGAGISGATVVQGEPPGKSYWWAVFFFVAAAGVWMAFRTFRITPSLGKCAFFAVLGVLLLGGSAYGAARVTDRGPINWVYYTPERFAAAQREGKIIVMDFTAEWCLNCKVIEANVLHQPRVVEALKLPGVVPMKVDLTGNNDAGNRQLRAAGRVMIPALVVFAPDGTQLLNSDLYTVEEVVGAVRGRSDR